LPEIVTLYGIPVALDWQLALLFAIVFLAGIIRGFAGFGSALLAVPALAVLYGPAQAVVIEVLLEIPVTLGLLPIAVRDAERRTVLPMLAMFVLFVPLGALLLKAVDPQLMKVGLSILVLIMVAIMAQQERLASFLSQKAILFAGALSGIAQGMTGMAGPLFVTALLARGEDVTLTRANIIALAGGLITISVISFWAVGLMHLQTVIYAALATPAIMLGVWTGSQLFQRMPHWNLRGIILVILAVTAVVTLGRTVM